MISIIFPTYNEQQNLIELYRRLVSVTSEIKDFDFEFIFVDDASSDETPVILRELHQKDRRVRVLRFSRNCGGHAAIAAGLDYCQGACAIPLAADLQDPPELIKRLIAKWKEGYNIVWGVRSTREGESLSTRIFSRLYYFLINRLTPVRMPDKGMDVFLADRLAIEAYKKLPEKNTSIYMLFAWLGFHQAHIEYVKEARHKGASKWTLNKKIKLLIDSLLPFSNIPVRFISGLGIVLALFGFLYALKVFWGYIHGTPVEGWSSLMVVILVIGGVQMIMLGVLGEYLWRTFDETRLRPKYILEYTLEQKDSEKGKISDSRESIKAI